MGGNTAALKGPTVSAPGHVTRLAAREHRPTLGPTINSPGGGRRRRGAGEDDDGAAAEPGAVAGFWIAGPRRSMLAGCVRVRRRRTRRGNSALPLYLSPSSSGLSPRCSPSEIAGGEMLETSTKSREIDAGGAVISNRGSAAPREKTKALSVRFCKTDEKAGVIRGDLVGSSLLERTGEQIKGAASNGDSPSDSVVGPLVCGSSSASGTPAPAIRSPSSLRDILSNSGRSIAEDSSANPRTKIAAAKAPATAEHGGRGGEREEEDSDVFSDALETLSRAGSCSMNCSTSGMSGGIDTPESSPSLSRNSDLREFIMDRFLPAAQALVSGYTSSSTRKTWNPARKPAICVAPGESNRRRQVSSPLSHPRNFAGRLHREYSSGGEENGEHAGPGLVKGCGLMPRFCMGSSFRLFAAMPGANPTRKSTRAGAPRDAEPEEEDDDNDDVFKLCADDGDRYWEMTPRRRARRAPGSSSNSAPAPETLASILSRPESESEADFTEIVDAIADEDLEARERLAATRQDQQQPSAAAAEKSDAPGETLLPPALPKSPTDSWLCRTLPSLSSRSPPRAQLRAAIAGSSASEKTERSTSELLPAKAEVEPSFS